MSIRPTTLIGLLVGMVVLTALFAWRGLADVFEVFAGGGWALLLVCIFEPPQQVLASEAWRCIFPRATRPRAIPTFLASWMGAAVNSLLPVATIGGEVAKARVLVLWGHPAVDSVSTIVVEKTAQALGVLVWGLIGIAMMALLVPDRQIIAGALFGAALLAVGIGGFVVIQLGGSLGLVARSTGRLFGAEQWRAIETGADAVDLAIRSIYRRPAAIALSTALHVISRVVLVGEVMVASHLIGHPLGFAEAVLLKGLVDAVRGLSFAVPAGIGVQEGGYVALGALLGMPADGMLALSLASRVREILPSIPLLMAWQNVEGRALWRRRRLPDDEDKRLPNRT